jgi:N-acetylmuramoyl-L-alanine amidase
MPAPKPLTICLDPGHGQDNLERGQYDPGATGTLNGIRHTEATIAFAYTTAIREILRAQGHTAIRTRRDSRDPAPVSRRDDVARAYGCQRMVSIHLNSYKGKTSGTEVFYRGADDQPRALKLAALVSNALGLPNRGAKTEKQSQHKSLAVMEFDKCWLIELGFIDNPSDLAAILDPGRMSATCHAIASAITAP